MSFDIAFFCKITSESKKRIHLVSAYSDNCQQAKDLPTHPSSSFLPFLDFSNFSLLTKLILFIWTVFITIGIWRSAENYLGNIFWIIVTLIFLSYRLFTLRLIFFG